MADDASTPRPGRMYVEAVWIEEIGARGRDFVIYGRSVPEVFSARLMDGSRTLKITWTASFGEGTLLNRLARIQKLVGGPDGFDRIEGRASDRFEGRIRSSNFDARKAERALGQRLGGTWRVDLVSHPESRIWDVVATRSGD